MFSSFFSKPSSSEQKRQTKRITCHYGVVCESGGTGFNGVVLDASLEGMRLAIPRKVKVGTTLKVTYSPDQRRKDDFTGRSIDLQVRWCRQKKFTSGVEVGGTYLVTHLQGTWVEQALAEIGVRQETSKERRKAVRAPVNPDFSLAVQVNAGTAGTLHGKVENLGQGGALLELGHPLETYSIVDVLIGPYYSLKQLKIRAQVVHNLAHPFPDTWSYGICFQGLTKAQTSLLSNYVDQLLRTQSDT